MLCYVNYINKPEWSAYNVRIKVSFDLKISNLHESLLRV